MNHNGKITDMILSTIYLIEMKTKMNKIIVLLLDFVSP